VSDYRKKLMKVTPKTGPPCSKSESMSAKTYAIVLFAQKILLLLMHHLIFKTSVLVYFRQKRSGIRRVGHKRTCQMVLINQKKNDPI
jgi:hypothetical protein